MSLPASPAIKTKPRPPLPFIRTGRSRIPLLAFGFVFAFVVSCTFLLVFNPSFSSPRWLNALLRSSASRSSSYTLPPIAPTKSQNFTSNSPPPSISPQESRNFTSSPPPPISPLRSDNLTSSPPPPPISPPPPPPVPEKESPEKKKKKSSGGSRKKKKKQCDLFDGRWVRDDSYHPFYQQGECPYIDEPFNCYVNGRPESDFLNYRWEPSGCIVPRFDALSPSMLKLLRGKRIVFVGDSLNRNMWESLVCMLRGSVKDNSRVFEASGSTEFRTEGYYSFIFKDFNCSVEFFRSTFLVREWEVEDKNGTKKDTLRLDMVEESAPKYKNADVLIFNTGHWWTHEKTSNGRGYYQEGNHVYDELSGDIAFEKALTTWGKWIDTNINPSKTSVFFRGYSPSHFQGGKWNEGGKCDKEHEPLVGDVEMDQVYIHQMNSFEAVSRKMKIPVYFLNITGMSNYRIDAHPSVYREQNSTEEERWSPLIPQDCTHWCLPGIPDTWNELLFHHLIYQQKPRRKTPHKRKKKKPHGKVA